MRIKRGHNTITVTVVGSDGNEYDVDVEYKGYSDPGRTCGPPEDCYPPEGEIEILKMTGLPEDIIIHRVEMEYVEDKCFEDLWEAA